MRIVCISDTHERHRKLGVLPEGDILIHAGDLSGNGKSWPLRDLGDWMRKQPHKHKVLIAGNHDLSLEKLPHKAQDFFYDLHYLDETEVTLGGLRIFGTPYSPAFRNWAFNAERGEECRQRWAKIPAGVDVLVVHGPPYGLGDTCPDYDDPRQTVHVGCPDLLARIEEVRPKLVVCGHIHEGAGTYITPSGVPIVNAAVLDGRYNLVNAPIVFEIPAFSS